jgi:ubiquinone/menaquinone biosynthesis C-methylase UbiE
MAANYNNSAWFYDRLSGLVYGKALVNAQTWLLPFIPAGSTILIVGGGTGRILEEIGKTRSGLDITYVEIAANMMRLSKKKEPGNNTVIFINEAIENVSPGKIFDVVITPFLFDNFTEQNLQKIFGHIHEALKPKGLWLNTDFQLTGKWRQGILLKSMFLFFRLVCGIEAKKLPDISGCFLKYGYTVIESDTLLGNFILSTVYKK